MANQDPWFFELRAKAFVSLVLTERHKLKILPYAEHDMGIDLLIEVLKNGKASMRFFGAQLVPSMDLPSVQSANERVLANNSGRDSFEGELPICVFKIGVRKPEGVYQWLEEPLVDGGRARLRRVTDEEWQPFDQAGVARLIGQVNAWYDARGAAAASAPPGPRVKTRANGRRIDSSSR